MREPAPAHQPAIPSPAKRERRRIGRWPRHPAIGRPERWHPASGTGGALRAGVFGANDGLVSNLSLVMGVAGAGTGEPVVLLAGIAGLLAGAFSMAAGEYVSVTAQRELTERQLEIERRELREYPEAEHSELTQIYQRKGVPQEQAREIAAALMVDPATALDTHAREELGIDPNELGSPWQAAGASFLLFAMGALVPVLPYLFLSGPAAFGSSAVLSLLALFLIGALLSKVTGRNLWLSGFRSVLIGAGAATITFLVGRLIGVSIS